MIASASAAAAVSIRIENASNLDFDAVFVFFPDHPGQAVSYGPIQKGAVSDYQNTSRAYRYAHVEAKVGNRTFTLRPIDYVGEEELPTGRFTYVLRIEGERLSTDLRKDE